MFWRATDRARTLELSSVSSSRTSSLPLSKFNTEFQIDTVVGHRCGVQIAQSRQPARAKTFFPLTKRVHSDVRAFPTLSLTGIRTGVLFVYHEPVSVFPLSQE